jgi:hypothetical protein
MIFSKKFLRALLPVLMMNVTMLSAGPSFGEENRTAPAQGGSTAAVGESKRGPVNRSADYTVNFINKGPATINVRMTDYNCMHKTGPKTFQVGPDDTVSVPIEDSNAAGDIIWWLGCIDAPKWVEWDVTATYHNENGSGQTDYSLEFFHKRDDGWKTEIWTTKGDPDGRGFVTKATCGGIDCLNTLAKDNGNEQIDIYFDDGFNGVVQRVKISSPKDRSAVPMQWRDDTLSADVSVSGVASAETQVSIADAFILGFGIPEWWTYADGNGQWNSIISFPSPSNKNALLPNSTTRILARSDADGGSYDEATVVNVNGITLDAPSSVNWKSNQGIAVNGWGNPGASVLVLAKQDGVEKSGCTDTVDTNTWKWSCMLSPAEVLPGETYLLTASQTDTNPWEWTDRLPQPKPLHINPLPLTITSPANGQHVDGDNPFYQAVSGTGTPNGQVVVWRSPSFNTCGQPGISESYSVTIDEDGNWSTGKVFHFPPSQSYTVTACQWVHGEHAPGATSTFNSWASLVITSPPNGGMLSSTTTEYTITGTGEPNATVTVSPIAGVNVCSPVSVNGSGQWSCRISGLKPGSYKFTATQSKSGQSDPPVPSAFSVAIPVTITQPAPNQQFPTGTAEIQLKGTGQPNALLNISVPGAKPCSDQITIPPSGQWECKVSGLEPDKSYTASVTQGSSGDVLAGMDWMDPAVTRSFSVGGFNHVTISCPTDGQIFAPATRNISACGTGQTGAVLTVSVPGANACAPQTIQGGSWTCAISGLAPGKEYILTASQSLNGETDNPPAGLLFWTAAPLVVNNPKENEVFPPQTTEIPFSGTGQPGASLSINTPGAAPCNTTVSSDDPNKGHWQCIVRSLTAGRSYTSTVTQNGTGWSDSVPRDFSIGQEKKIAITHPTNGRTYSSNNPPDGLEVEGTGQDGAVAEVVVGSLPKKEAAIVRGAWATKPFDLKSFGANGASLQVTATQIFDNIRESNPPQVTIKVAKVAKVTQPSCVIQQSCTVTEKGGQITLVGIGQDGAKIDAEVMEDGTRHGGCSTTVNSGGWSCVLTGLAPDTQYSLVVTQSGADGTWADLPINGQFKTAPASSLAITYPQSSAPANTSYDVRGTGEPSATVEVKVFGVKTIGTTTVKPDKTWELPKVLFSTEGCYSLTASQTMQGYPLPNPQNTAQATVWYSVGGQQACPPK